MEYFAPGLRELSRILGRQWLRLRLLAQRRRLAASETTLGLLGWEQAEFDTATQAQVRRIIDFERQQTQAMNESAAVGQSLRALAAECDASRKQHEAACAGIDEQRRQILSKHPQIEHQLAAKRRIEPTFQKKIPQLDRELREVQRLHSQLLITERQTPQMKAELLRLRERAVAIPNEKNDLRMLHLRAVTEIRALEMQLEREREALDALEKVEREHKEKFKTADDACAEKLRQLERQRAAFEKRFKSLEGDKANPYREVGRVLADSNVAPVNQPHALDEVRKRRFAIQETEYAVAASAAASAREDRVQLRRSLLLWLGIGASVVALLTVIASRS